MTHALAKSLSFYPYHTILGISVLRKWQDPCRGWCLKSWTAGPHLQQSSPQIALVEPRHHFAACSPCWEKVVAQYWPSAMPPGTLIENPCQPTLTGRCGTNKNQQLVLHVRDLPWACGSLQFETATVRNLPPARVAPSSPWPATMRTFHFIKKLVIKIRPHKSLRFEPCFPKSGPWGTGKPTDGFWRSISNGLGLVGVRLFFCHTLGFVHNCCTTKSDS